jgi:Tfp pilus assembly protein PilN
MKLINLLPKAEQRELKLQSFADQLTMFWICAIVSIVFFVALTYTAKIYLEGQMTETESQIAVEKQVLKSSDNELLKKQVETMNAQIAGIKNLQSQHYNWSAALMELARLIPPDMIIDTLDAERATGEIHIEGMSATRESVLLFWANMHKSEYFGDINFPLSNLNFPTNDPYEFTFYVVPEAIKNK